MNITEITELWKSDSEIDRTELGNESLKIPKLHSKYYNLFIQERLTLKKLEGDYKQLYRVKFEYYNGILSEEELEEYGFQPFALKVLKTDLPIYIESDKDLQTLQAKIAIQKEKIEFLESIIKSLTNRGFQIKSAIDFMKFQHGVM